MICSWCVAIVSVIYSICVQPSLQETSLVVAFVAGSQGPHLAILHLQAELVSHISVQC